jgi:hypothetical protein
MDVTHRFGKKPTGLSSARIPMTPALVSEFFPEFRIGPFDVAQKVQAGEYAASGWRNEGEALLALRDVRYNFGSKFESVEDRL